MSTPRFAHGPVLMNMHLGMQIPRFPNLCWNCLAPITVTSLGRTTEPCKVKSILDLRLPEIM